MKTFFTAILKLDDHFAKIANVAIMINIVVVMINVIGRVLFNTPLRGQYDTVAVVFVIACMASICYTEKEQRHVRMDLVMQVLPRRGKVVLHSILGVLTLAISLLIPIGFYRYIFSTYANHDSTMTTSIPYWPFVIVCFVGSIFFVLTFFVNMVRAYKEWKVVE